MRYEENKFTHRVNDDESQFTHRVNDNQYIDNLLWGVNEHLIKLEKVAMYAQELLHPKGSEPMDLTEQARNENKRRERLSQALNELNKDWGKQ